MRRTVGYLRVSTRGQEEHGLGLDAQRTRIKTYAREHDLELVDVVHESASGAVREGELSSREHRPVLNALLERAEQTGDFGVLLVSSFDRLSRDQIDGQLLKRWFGKYGVRCISAAGESNGAEGPMAELMDRLIGAIHDYDRKEILRRMGAGKAEGKRQGRHVHGRLPYAYRSAGDGRLEPDAELAPIVRRIFEDVRHGYTPGRVARGLNVDSIRSPQGAAWTRKAVQRIITNPIYAGERYGVKRAHPAIVSRQLWNAANAALKARSRDSATG